MVKKKKDENEVISLSQTIITGNDSSIEQTSLIKEIGTNDYITHRHPGKGDSDPNTIIIPGLTKTDIDFIIENCDKYISLMKSDKFEKKQYKKIEPKTISPIFTNDEYFHKFEDYIDSTFVKYKIEYNNKEDIWYKDFFRACVDSYMRKKLESMKKGKKKIDFTHANYFNNVKGVFDIIWKNPDEYPTCVSPIKIELLKNNRIQITESLVEFKHPEKFITEPIDSIFNKTNITHDIFIIFHKLAYSYDLTKYLTDLTTSLNGSKKRKLNLVTSEKAFNQLYNNTIYKEHIKLSNTLHSLSGTFLRRITQFNKNMSGGGNWRGKWGGARNDSEFSDSDYNDDKSEFSEESDDSSYNPTPKKRAKRTKTSRAKSAKPKTTKKQIIKTTTKIKSIINCFYKKHILVFNGVEIIIFMMTQDNMSIVLDPHEDYLKLEYLSVDSIGFKRWFALEYAYSKNLEFTTQIDDTLDIKFLTWLPLCEFHTDNTEYNKGQLDSYSNSSIQGIGAFTKFYEFSEDFYLTLSKSQREDIGFIGPTGMLSQSSTRLRSQPYGYRENKINSKVWYKIYSMFPNYLKKKDIHYRPDLGFMIEDADFNLECFEENVIQLDTSNFLVSYKRGKVKCSTATINEMWPIEPYLQLIKDGQLRFIEKGKIKKNKTGRPEYSVPCPGSVISYPGKNLRLAMMGNKDEITNILAPVSDNPKTLIAMFDKTNQHYFTYKTIDECLESFTNLGNPYLMRWVILYWIYLLETAIYLEETYNLKYPILHKNAFKELSNYITALQIHFPGSNLNYFNFNSYLNKLKNRFNTNTAKYNKKETTKFCKFNYLIEYLEKMEIPSGLCNEGNDQCKLDYDSDSETVREMGISDDDHEILLTDSDAEINLTDSDAEINLTDSDAEIILTDSEIEEANDDEEGFSYFSAQLIPELKKIKDISDDDANKKSHVYWKKLPYEKKALFSGKNDDDEYFPSTSTTEKEISSAQLPLIIPPILPPIESSSDSVKSLQDLLDYNKDYVRTQGNFPGIKESIMKEYDEYDDEYDDDDTPKGNFPGMKESMMEKMKEYEEDDYTPKKLPSRKRQRDDEINLYDENDDELDLYEITNHDSEQAFMENQIYDIIRNNKFLTLKDLILKFKHVDKKLFMNVVSKLAVTKTIDGLKLLRLRKKFI